jgi:hypothetical protein
MTNLNSKNSFALRLLAIAVCITSTAAFPVSAQQSDSATTKTSMEDVGPSRLSDLGTHINPQLGVSSFEQSARTGGSKERFSGGVTAEFGEGMRRLETGILMVQAGGQATIDGQQQSLHATYLTFPMLAKLRVAELASQSWFVKGGLLTGFATSRSDKDEMSAIDVMASLGASGRFAFTKRMDFIVDATYNRGLFETVRTSTASASFNQGVLVLAGVSLGI